MHNHNRLYHSHCTNCLSPRLDKISSFSQVLCSGNLTKWWAHTSIRCMCRLTLQSSRICVLHSEPRIFFLWILPIDLFLRLSILISEHNKMGCKELVQHLSTDRREYCLARGAKACRTPGICTSTSLKCRGHSKACTLKRTAMLLAEKYKL